jgi:hypothetical protein
MPVMRSLSAAVMVATLTLEITLAQAPSISPITTSTPPLTTSANSLEHVVELTGQLDQRLLTTVYWCLGTLVTVFLILIGYNWFVNFRIHERDFRELKNAYGHRPSFSHFRPSAWTNVKPVCPVELAQLVWLSFAACVQPRRFVWRMRAGLRGAMREDSEGFPVDSRSQSRPH